MKSFFHHGIPPLVGARSESKSRGSVSNEKHKEAELVDSNFGLFPDGILKKQDSLGLWINYTENGEVNNWGCESDIQGLVRQVLKAAIYTVGLEGKVKCFNELSIFDLRPDIWSVCEGGAPIGVVEAKKPAIDDEDETLENTFVQGELFDYMLRLQSFFGLQHVFGLLSTYERWRVCWMPCSQRAAASTSISATQTAEHLDKEVQTVVPERVLHGSKLFHWDDPDLPRMLCTSILKMYKSPISEVNLIDKNRPYIIIDEAQWSWDKIALNDETSLYHSVLPTANKFTLLMDLREGADGRVWRACTDAGLGCCIKFPMRTRFGEDVTIMEQTEQIQEEAANWVKAYGDKAARVATLCGRPALIMRYLRPLELHDGCLSAEDQAAVKTAIEKVASKGLRHDDLALRHLGILSPPKKQKGSKSGTELDPEIVLFDLGRVSTTVDDPTVAIADMMSQMNLM